MIDGWTIAPFSLQGGLTLAVALALFGWCIILYKRGEGPFFWTRTVLSFMAITALTALVFGPFSNRNVTGISLAVLTKGYKQNELDSLKQKENDLLSVHYDQGAWKLWDSSFMAPVERIYLLGDGLEDIGRRHLQRLGLPFSYLASAPPEGIVSIDYANEVYVTEELKVVGRTRNTSDGPMSVKLSDATGTLDSATIDGSEGDFVLSCRPVVPGRFVYKLSQRLSGTDKWQEIDIAVNVRPVPKQRVVILTAYPSFEMNSIKSWLVENGHTVSVRDRVSKGRFSYEAHGANVLSESATEKLLEHAELMIIHYSEWVQLRRVERDRVVRAVKTGGLNIIFWTDRMPEKNTWPGGLFDIDYFDRQKSMEMSGEKIGLLSDIKIYGRMVFALDERLGSGAGAVTRYGNGLVGLVNLEGINTLSLRGKKEVISQLLAMVFSPFLKVPDGHRLVVPKPLVENKNVILKVINKGKESVLDAFKPNAENNTVAEVPLFYQKSPELSNVGHTTIFGTSIGWHSLLNKSGYQKWFYVQPSGGIAENIFREEKIIKNIAELQAENVLANIDGGTQVTSKEKDYFWRYILGLVFVLSAGGVWVVERF